MSGKVGLYLKRRFPLFVNNEYEIFEKFKYYNYNEIALLSIGIWNGHSCYSATERIHDLAERANIFIKQMRENGSHIIHCGSYSNYHCKEGDWEQTKLRKNMKGHDMAILKDKGLNIPPLPLDDSDGGYEKEDKNLEYNKKSVSIHPKIEIDYENDCISGYSKEILNYLYAKKIKCVLVFGTHTNMCVLDKPYGIKWFIRYGFPTVCVRNLCDTMYNPKMHPFVSQKESNTIMNDWLEKYICPTIDSNQILNLNKKVIIVDIDHTITIGNDYENCQPKKDIINKLNQLYDNGHNIVYWTSRGVISDNNWYDYTYKQLKKWNVKFNLLITKKPFFNKFIEDKSINLDTKEGISLFKKIY
tara:strand:- start:1020 stop:2093 length:1074 start_codon:yes stop_codon:yes gene_type:complete